MTEVIVAHLNSPQPEVWSESLQSDVCHARRSGTCLARKNSVTNGRAVIKVVAKRIKSDWRKRPRSRRHRPEEEYAASFSTRPYATRDPGRRDAAMMAMAQGPI